MTDMYVDIPLGLFMESATINVSNFFLILSIGASITYNCDSKVSLEKQQLRCRVEAYI